MSPRKLVQQLRRLGFSTRVSFAGIQYSKEKEKFEAFFWKDRKPREYREFIGYFILTAEKRRVRKARQPAS